MLISIAALLPLLATCTPSPTHTYDVIVVGAGTSGIAAAIQAARRPGTSVALLEEGTEIGGQIVAAGVTTIDGGFRPPLSISGVYEEYRTLVRSYYANLEPPLAVNTCYDGSAEHTCTEPRVSRNRLLYMLEQSIPPGSNLCVFLGHPVSRVTKVNDRVTGVISSAIAWHSHVVIDATEYGDVIPMTGAVYRIGRSLSTEQPPDPSNCIDDITYVAITRQYETLPEALRMPESANDDERAAEFHTLVGAGEWPGECRDPENSWTWHQQYRGLPDSSPSPPAPLPPPRTRTGVNYANDYPGYYIWCPPPPDPPEYIWRDRLSAKFIQEPAFRRDVTCAAKLRTLQFLHYMQRATELPSHGGAWAIADDEYASPNTCPSLPADLLPFERLLPPMPYVRESRRILSVDTLTGAEISRPGNPDWTPSLNRMPHALALGDHYPDQHNCENPLTDFEPEEDLANTTYHSGAFQIPFETFIPQVVDGFLPAEKNLGYTRLAASAARMQPSTMLVGQAAGAIAALAARGYDTPRQPRHVRVLDVQKDLLSSGAAISLDTFVDVPKGHARWADTQLVSTYDIMTGFTPAGSPGHYTFVVDYGIGRAATAAAVIRAFRIPTPMTTTQTFRDVLPSHPEFVYVEAMAREGFDTSCYLGPEYFCPGLTLDRPRLAKWLAHARWGLNVPDPPPGQQSFADVDLDHPDYKVIEAVAGEGREGLMFPCSANVPPLFCPNTSASGGDVAQSAAQALYKYWP